MSSFLVNTDWKCWLSMFAFVRLSDLMNPSFFVAAECLIGCFFDDFLCNCKGAWD